MGTIAEIFESGEHSSKKGLFNNLIMLARVDGFVSETEIQLLNRIARKLSLTSEQVKEIIEHPDQYPLIPPYDRNERCDRFITLVEMTFADGVIDDAEFSLIKKYGIALGFTEREVAELDVIVINEIQNGTAHEEILKMIL